uniref:Uncharacterized protein n=1 Tax=Elphidium margaritaceum TaxID=933848 RepID=A0A7S0TFF0_9EUKA
MQTLSLSTALSDETTQHAAAATNDRSELLLHIASNVDHEHKVNIQLHCLRFAHVNDRNEWWKAIQSMVVRRRASAEKRISTHSRNPNLATGKYKMRLHAR